MFVLFNDKQEKFNLKNLKTFAILKNMYLTYFRGWQKGPLPRSLRVKLQNEEKENFELVVYAMKNVSKNIFVHQL